MPCFFGGRIQNIVLTSRNRKPERTAGFSIGVLFNMFGFLNRIIWGIIANMVGLAISERFLNGVHIAAGGDNYIDYIIGLVTVSVIYMLIYAVLGRALRALTLPLAIITLGLFIFIVNGVVLYVTSHVTELLVFDDFTSAICAAVVIWIMNIILHVFKK